jgi:hypothetical protein
MNDTTRAEPESYSQLSAALRRKAGHYEILGETYAKFEFFQRGWNPYSRFLDVDNVDLILRRRAASGQIVYREIQVKFGKLYPCGPAWERELFDFTSWRFFKENEFANRIKQKDFFIAYVLARDGGYQGDIFIFPVLDFVNRVILEAIPSGGKRKVYLSRLRGQQEKWVLRRKNRFTEVSDDACLEVTNYRRNFQVLETI